MMFFNNNYYEEYGNLGRAGDLARAAAGAADAARAADAAADAAKAAADAAKAADVAREAGRISNIGTDYTKFDFGTPQRRFSYDNYLKSNITPPKILIDPPKVQRIETDLNKIDNLDNVKVADDIPDINPDAKKLINETPENMKADLTPENQAKFDTESKKLVEEINKPEFKSKSSKEKFESVKKWIEENPKKTMAMAAATTVGIVFLGMYIKSQINTNKINNTDYKITSITSNEDTVTVLYDPRDKFTLMDTIVISKTNSIPVIDGSNIRLKYVGNGVITFSGEKITTNGTDGKLECRTTVEDQFTQIVTDASKPLTDIPTNILSNTIGNIIDKFIPEGIKDFFKNFWWVVLIICILILSSSSAAIAFVYLK